MRERRAAAGLRAAAGPRAIGRRVGRLVGAALAAAALAAALAGCGGVSAGDACSTDGAGACDGARGALECWQGRLRAVPCRGPGGCTSSSAAVRCDESANVPGDACFHVADGKVRCARDGRSLYRCAGGTLALASNCARGCTVTGPTATCEP